MKKLLLVPFLFLFVCTYAQELFPKNGPQDERLGYYALTNATIYVSADQILNNATLVIKNGKVVTAGNVPTPKGAVEVDLTGKTIYPSFIELNSAYGVHKEPKKKRDWNSGPQDETSKKGAYGWNEAIHPEISASEGFTVNSTDSDQLRKLGFGTALVHNNDGIARGTGAFVSLTTENDNEALIKPVASEHFSFSKGSSTQDYPSSLMGSISLLRQSHYDAEWYKNNGNVTNLSLEAWNKNKSLPAFFATTDVLDVLRVRKLGKEIQKDFIVVGSGDEYQRVEELKESGAKMVVPLKFPKAYDVSDNIEANKVSFKDLKHWEMAPSNLSFLNKEGVSFAITSSKLGKGDSFIKNLRKASNYIDEKELLRALTATPAKFVGLENKVGSLQAGKLANFIVTDGNLFTDKKASILENWVQGHKYSIKEQPTNIAVGDYMLKVKDSVYDLSIKNNKKLSYELLNSDDEKVKVNGSFDNNMLSITFQEGEGYTRLTGWKSDGVAFKGTGTDANGNTFEWLASPKVALSKESVEESEEKKSEEVKSVQQFTKNDLVYPFIGYGWKEQPTQQKVLFKNATVWTNEQDGILTQTDVLIQAGKILKIGNNLSVGDAVVVDATGKHLTSGIIDEHSHISISKGVNEGTQASSSEVRIGDVINSEHIGLYRVLAGGVTTSQLLHGSANPIGGQSAIIKSRWGLAPEELKFEGADGFIKFALGENVKQSNWGSQYNKRYPQTRMGVEQVYNNYFTLAKEYEQALKTNPAATRRDLELDALVEILNDERFISCHSYVQSEINMLMKTAEKFDFRVNTFTHILEGYKVADKMKEHGVGGSTFSDWWGYKYEVIDAIPYNAAIMHNQGIVTAINSDDAEMARRLNQEAAKTIKYGGLSQEEAWKTVTLNPAKLLHIDDKVGSIKVGKDADLVLWSDNPLSIYAVAEQTYVDGRKYFDKKASEQKEKEIQLEKNRIIQLMLKEKLGGAPTQEPKTEKEKYYTCDTIGETGSLHSKHTH